MISILALPAPGNGKFVKIPLSGEISEGGFNRQPAPATVQNRSQAHKSPLTAGLTLKSKGDMGRTKKGAGGKRTGFFTSLGVETAKVFSCRQVHSDKVICITEPVPEKYRLLEADGLVTNLEQAFLTVTVADCLPIFIADKKIGKRILPGLTAGQP